MSSTKDKLQLFAGQMRRLWPQYDPDLTFQLGPKDVIVNFIRNVFENAELHESWNQFKSQKKVRIDQLIQNEAKADVRRADTEDIKLNQQQILNVVKQMLVGKSNRVTSAAKRPKAPEASGGDYLDHYYKVKEMAAKKRWDQATMNKMLGDRIAFQKLEKSTQNQRNKNGVIKAVENARITELHNEAIAKKARYSRVKKEKEILEVEQAYMMAQKPTQKLTKVRSLSKFMDDQKKHEMARCNSIQEILLNEENERSQLFQPNIRSSMDVLEKKGKHWSEVYNQSSQRKVKRQQDYLNQSNYSFKPRINKSSQSIDRGVDNDTYNNLVQDAKRRQTVKKQIKAVQEEKEDFSSQRVVINSNSDKVMFERFDADFNVAVDHFVYISQDELQNGISYTTLVKLFNVLGFIRMDDASGQKDKLVSNIWRSLGGYEYDPRGDRQAGLKRIQLTSIIPLHFCKIFMCCIQNFHLDFIIDASRDEIEEVNPACLGRVEGDDIYYTTAEISHISKKYVLLYKNRQAKYQDDLRAYVAEKKEVKAGPQQRWFNPKISDVNRQLAKKRLGQNSRIPIEDRLNHEKILIAQKREQMKLEQEANEPEHPFMPQISRNSKEIVESKSKERKSFSYEYGNTQTKWDELYLEGLENSKKDKRDLKGDETDFMKAAHEYSFQPNKKMTRSQSTVVRSNHLMDTSTTSSNSKRRSSFKAPLDQGRTRLANDDYRRKSFMERSNSSSSVVSRNSRCEELSAQEHQTFQVCVNIGNDNHEIEAQLNQKPIEIAQRFINEHNIGNEYLEVLAELIQEQIRNVRFQTSSRKGKANAADLPDKQHGLMPMKKRRDRDSRSSIKSIQDSYQQDDYQL